MMFNLFNRKKKEKIFNDDRVTISVKEPLDRFEIFHTNNNGKPYDMTSYNILIDGKPYREPWHSFNNKKKLVFVTMDKIPARKTVTFEWGFYKREDLEK